MNKDELVRKLAEEFGISTIDIYQLVNTVIESMSGALTKGKNINISEFGKFKTLTRKDEAGNTFKTVSFSPVKKFAHEVNFRYNDLNPTPMGLSRQEEDLEEVYEKEVALIEEVSKNNTFVTQNLSENINPSVMDNKDKYDGNIIRDEISKDPSNDDAINAFINSKLEKSQNTENKVEGGIKEFELPHTLIELHNDITNVNESFDTSNDEKKEEAQPIELPEINDTIDIESLIEERKKALEDISPEYDAEPVQEQTNENIIEDSINLQAEDRDKLDEFRSFEDERNAELSKIIAERNKIIDDIQEMVNNTDYIPQMKESPEEEKSFESLVESNEDNSFDTQTETPVETPLEQKPFVEDLPPLQEDKTFEHKFQYDETNLIPDNFDPIVIEDEVTSSQKDDFIGNDMLTPADSQNFKTENNQFEKTPTSFEDVFETKDEAEKQKNLIHSSLPPVNQDNIKKDAPPPPVMQNVQKQAVSQSESYRQRMKKREQMYTESSNKAKKKGFWITAIITGFLLLIIYLAYNTGSFTPSEDQSNGNQQNSEQQNEQNNSKQTPPPVTDEQKQETTPDESKQGNQQTTEQNQDTPTNTPEEVIFDNGLNVAFIKASDGIYIQTASLKNKSDADKMASGINKGNKEVFVKEADLGDKGKYYRVRIGKFTSMEEAKEFAGKLK